MSTTFPICLLARVTKRNLIQILLPVVVLIFLGATLPLSAQQQPEWYVFKLVSLHIAKTRARHLDTDYATFVVQVGDHKFEPQTKYLGDVNDGDHAIDLKIGPVEISDPNTAITLGYAVVNNGHSSRDAVIHTMAEIGSNLMGEQPDSDPWGIVARVLLQAISILSVDCDGIVAANRLTITPAQLIPNIGVERPYYMVEQPH